MTFVHVAVDLPARAGTLFTYAVPPGMIAAPGSVVIVPFSSRIVPGIVVATASTAPDMPTKPLLAALADSPAIEPYRVETARWIAEHYRDSLFASLSLFMPPAWRRAIHPVIQPDAEGRRWGYVWPAAPVVDETILGVPAAFLATEGSSSRRSARDRVLAVLGSRGAMSASDLATEARCSVSTLRSMVKEGLVAPREGETEDRAPLLPRSLIPAHAQSGIVLNEAQTAAFAPIAVALESHAHQVFLLHGVTGSGKTHVYFRLIEAAVRTGRRAIVLVSEIAQTPEALERYAERFPGRVALLHSALPAARRSELWRGIYEGRFDVVVGPRSALFSPVPDLGLIVLDEEHEPSYKQDDLSPRYHARDVAVEMGRRAGIPVILGSATPDVGSYYLASRGEYQLLSLPDRYSGETSRGVSSGKLPRVQIVDLRDELRAGNSSILGRALQAGVHHALDNGQQAILFLNRRGSSTAVVCRDCGHVMECGRCQVALVYHRSTASMLCHQCNRETPLPEKCPSCRGRRISYFGAGTERVEEEVRKLFPSARVLRWDHDVAVQKGGHARVHDQFRRHEADVLVGTQMVAKALDFPLVTLVGVVLADVTLHLPDFRAAERTFQLLSQVAGRAGRGEAEGRVVIQTYSPDHYAVVAAAGHDYIGFYEQELEFRRQHLYPPFRRLTRLLFVGTGEVRARYEALQMKKRLDETAAVNGIPDVEIIGPAPAFHSRVRSRWRWQIVLGGDGTGRLLSMVDLPRGWSVDVEPVSLL